MKKILILLALMLAIPIAASAQTSLSTTVCPGAGCVVYQVGGQGAIGIQVSNTFSGTLTFYGSIDGGNYYALPMTPIAGGATVSVGEIG